MSAQAPLAVDAADSAPDEVHDRVVADTKRALDPWFPGGVARAFTGKDDERTAQLAHHRAARAILRIDLDMDRRVSGNTRDGQIVRVAHIYGELLFKEHRGAAERRALEMRLSEQGDVLTACLAEIERRVAQVEALERRIVALEETRPAKGGRGSNGAAL